MGHQDQDEDEETTRFNRRSEFKNIQRMLAIIAMVIGIFGAVWTGVKSFVLLPSQIEALQKSTDSNETRIKAVELKSFDSHESYSVLVMKMDAMNNSMQQIESEVREIRRRQPNLP